MEDKITINTDVLEEMASIAAKEVEGVYSLAEKAVDIKGAINKGKILKPAKVTEVNGAIEIDLYICVEDGFNATAVAEKVQNNVKDKVQNMSGTVITRVDVNVADIHFQGEEN